MPVAVNCCVVASTMLGVGGVTEIDANVAGVTVKVTGVEAMLPTAAVILLLPVARVLARPLEPAALLMVATEFVADAQVTDVVRFWVELSV